MAIARRVVRYMTLAVVAVVVTVAGLILILSRTDFGVDRTGRFVVERLERSINGSLTVGRVTSGSLLQGVTLHDMEIADVDGRPFVRADSARLAYRIRTLLAGSVVFDRLILYSPDVTIERLPGNEDWNYDRILTDSSAAQDTAAADADRGLILIRDATVHDGRVTVRMPWVGDADADTSRLLLESVPGGTVRTLRFDSVGARLPRVVWEAPGSEGQVLEIEELTTRAFIWDSPLDLEELDGTVTIRDSVIGFEADRVRLPDSELSLEGRIVRGQDGDTYDVRASSGRFALADLRWVYPRLPTEGGGSARLRIQTQESGNTLWLVQDARIRTQGNHIAGSFGVVTGGPLRFSGVDMRLSPLDLDVLATILPDGLPVSGLVIGDIEADGPWAALRTRGEVRYRTFDGDGGGAESSVRWDGVLGGERSYVLRDMEVELEAVDLAQVAQFAPELRLRGVARGTLRVDGSLDDGARVSGDLSLTQAGRRSSVRGSGRLALGDPPTFDLHFDAEPVALELLAQQVPALEGLRGDARGPVTVVGSLDDLTVDADIMTPAGAVVVEGGLVLGAARPRYRAEGAVTEFRLDRIAPDLPETVVTGHFTMDGAGLELADLSGELAVDLLSASVSGMQLYRGMFRGTVSDGLARVDSMSVATEIGDARARGTFGLVEDRPGELAVSVRADSLMVLEPLLLVGGPPVELGRDQDASVGGTITVDGRLTGSLARWRVGGTAETRSLMYNRVALGRGDLEVMWQPDSLRVAASLDSLRYGGRRLVRATGELTYASGAGLVTADLHAARGDRLMVESAFEPEGEVVHLGLRRMELVTGDGEWLLADTAMATVGGNGLQVDSVVLISAPTRARIRVGGVLPWRAAEAGEVQEASLSVEVDSVRIGEFLRATQTDTLVDGVLTGSFQVTGTAREPRMHGRMDVRPFRYGGAVLDSVEAEVTYGARRGEGRFTGWQRDTPIITGRGRVPIQLALTDVDERLVDEPMNVDFRADGVPAGLLGFLAPGFRDLDGQVQGDLALIGTPVHPDLRGALEITDGSAYYEPLAVGYRDVRATARMVEGTEVRMEVDLATESGRGRIQGTLDMTEPGDPAFDLTVDAQQLDAAHRRDVTAVVTGSARLQGRYTRPVISGDLRLVRGEMNLDEIWRQYQIVQLDTTLFQMMDTTSVSYRPEPGSPFLENLRVTNTTLTTRRNFWLRSAELNVQVGGSLALEVDRQADDLRLTGALEVVEGSYQLLARGLPSGRRFEIREGNIEFVGTPGIDPNLDIEAAYRVRRARGEPINVVASVTGTLQDPRVTLASDSDVPLSETDLASYILFGRAGAELSQAQLDMAAGGALAAGLGLIRPAVSGAASTGIQWAAASLGLPLDYVAFSLPEYGVASRSAGGTGGLLEDAQIEVGFDPMTNVSVIGSVRIPGSDTRDDRTFGLRLSGARLEYRPWQTWTIEGYLEDQFARTPSFGPAEISDRKVLGLSLFREWGY